MDNNTIILLFLIFLFLLVWEYIWSGLWYNSTKYKLLLIKIEIINYLHEKNISKKDIKNIENRFDLIISHIKNFLF